MGLLVGIVGGRTASDELLDMAYEVGFGLAQNGCIVISGGLGGIMEAGSRGARDGGGITVGILPGDDIGAANPHIMIPIATGLGIGRNVIIAKTSQGLIAIGGEYGTLSEVAFALQLGKPVIGIRSWRIKGMFHCETPKEAVEMLLSILKEKSRTCVSL